MSSAQRTWQEVDRYVEDLLLPPDEALTSALAACDAAGLPAIGVTPAQGKLLMLLARGCGARSILEIGTLGGYSAIWLAHALPDDGCLTTIEYEAAHFQVARDNIARAGLADRVDLRFGSALDILPRLAAERRRPFDFIFIDADKRLYAEFFALALNLSRPGTLIVADNVVRKGAVADPTSEDEMVRGVQRFLAAVAAESRVSATVMQTVGSKGYDGWAIALVTGSA